MLDPNYMIRQYKNFVETFCTRSFEEHREMPCQVLKDTLMSDSTTPKCKGCSYEKVQHSA